MKAFIRSIAALALLIALACVIYITQPAELSAPARPSHPLPADPLPEPTSTPIAAKPQVAPERPALIQLNPPATNTAPRSPLADKLNAPDGTPTQDLAIVLNLFDHYRERYGGVPTGESNAAFVNALAGNNPRRLAFIDRHHPAINARGELVDRWGTPFFFHLQSRESLEVRSAGPDREFYTADDLVTGPRGTASL